MIGIQPHSLDLHQYSNLAGSIKAAFPNLNCETAETSEVVADLLRGLRQHGQKLIKQLQPGDIERSILGLGHAYSRAKVKFSVQKNDNHIIRKSGSAEIVNELTGHRGDCDS